MARLKYSKKMVAGWSVGDFLAYRLGFLRARLGGWLAVSGETGVALSTIRLIRRHLGILGKHFDLDRFVTVATYEKIEIAFFKCWQDYLLRNREAEELASFVPSLT